MVFCPYLTLGDGLRLCCVDALFCALRFTAFVCQGRMVFCPYVTSGDGLRFFGVGAKYFVPFACQHSYVRAEWYSAPTLL